jgi:hypothetical protein
LYAAAGVHGASHNQHNHSIEQMREDAREGVQLVMALLEAGADPFATFNRRNPNFKNDGDDNTNDEIVHTLLSQKKNRATEFEQVTILHDLLEENELVHPILDLAILDPNRRDARGRTVLMVARHSRHGVGAPANSLFGISDPVLEPSMPSFLDRLLALGADPVATDVEARNVLHQTFAISRGFTYQDITTFTRLATEYPVLVNQNDIYGKRLSI